MVRGGIERRESADGMFVIRIFFFRFAMSKYYCSGSNKCSRSPPLKLFEWHRGDAGGETEGDTAP
jgi:hypothetical protein